MNNSYQAKNGFKTFVFALIISLGLFGVFYYVTSYSTDEFDIETHSEIEVLGESQTAFGKLAEEDMDIQPRYVLAGTDIPSTGDVVTTGDSGTTGTDYAESTGSTSSVPETGSVGITLAFMISLTNSIGNG